MKLYDLSQGHNFNIELSEHPYIGEVEAKGFEFGDIISVDGAYYACSVAAADRSYAGVEKIQIDMSPDDKDYENHLTCPYCGYADRDSWELSDSEDDHKCGRCGAVISFERHVEVTYCSQAVRPPNIIDCDWVKED